MSWPWSELGLPGPAELRSIRAAYAERLKTTHPEEDPEGFQRLHAAYQEASRQARRNRPAPAENTQTPETSLSREAPPPPPETPEPREPEWDYGALLEEDADRPPAAPPEETPQAPDWDFERLFAEGEEEAREARRRRQEALREKDKKEENWFSRWQAQPYPRQARVVVFFVLLALSLFVTWSGFAPGGDGSPEARWTEQAPQWLEEDYGEPFVHAASQDIFAPAADPDLYFRASPWGERSEDWPGYQTNYPHILVKRALEDFARERELDLELASYSHDAGDAPGAYLLNLPLSGAAEDVAALGELLEDLSRRDWYRVPPVNPGSEAEYRTREPVKYTVFLCHKGLAFYEAPSDEGFDTEEALALYAQAGPAFCRYILENSGLAAEHLGEGSYDLQDRETATIGDGTFFQVRGVEKDTGQARVRYLLASGGSALFCIPEEKMEQIRSVTDLYRGTPRHLQLDKIGLVMVTDQMPEK